MERKEGEKEEERGKRKGGREADDRVVCRGPGMS